MTRQAWSRWMGWTVVAVVVADWVSKFLITNRLAVGGHIAVIDRWLYLVHQRNAGISFSWFGGAHGWWRTPALTAVAVVGIVALALLGRTAARRSTRIGIALTLAGAIGNLGDRIVHGGVTDFLLVRYFPFVFNVADIAITAGALLLAFGLGTRPAPPEATA